MIEDERDHITHGEIGAYPLGLWGLPYPIVEAVAYHHEPRRVPEQRSELLGIVHVADALAGECSSAMADSGRSRCGAPPELDVEYLLLPVANS